MACALLINYLLLGDISYLLKLMDKCKDWSTIYLNIGKCALKASLNKASLLQMKMYLHHSSQKLYKLFTENVYNNIFSDASRVSEPARFVTAPEILKKGGYGSTEFKNWLQLRLRVLKVASDQGFFNSRWDYNLFWLKLRLWPYAYSGSDLTTIPAPKKRGRS